MTLVSPTQSNPGDELTDTLLNTPHNQIADVLNGNIDDTNISAISGTKISSGTIPAAAMTTDSNPETRFNEAIPDFVASGCVWSATTGLNGTMTSGVVYVDGKRLVVASVSSHTFTASKDTYISVNNTGTVEYSETTNGGTMPSLPSNSTWLYKVVTSGSAVTTVTSLSAHGLEGSSLDWTPTFTNLSGGTLNYAKFDKVGKTVDFRFKYTLAGAGVAGAVSFTLPINASSTYAADSTEPIDGSVILLDTGTAFYVGQMYLSSATTVIIRVVNASATYATLSGLSSTVPHTWASTDVISVSGTYRSV